MRGRARLVSSAVTVGGICAAFAAPGASFSSAPAKSAGPGLTRGSAAARAARRPPLDRTVLADYRASPTSAAATLVALGSALAATPAPATPDARVPAPTTGPAAPTATPDAGSEGALSRVWACIRARESGGDYAADTGNGYYGAYQFSEATWRSIGGRGYPDEATPATQDVMAQRLQQRSGWGQWSTHRMCGV